MAIVFLDYGSYLEYHQLPLHTFICCLRKPIDQFYHICEFLIFLFGLLLRPVFSSSVNFCTSVVNIPCKLLIVDLTLSSKKNFNLILHYFALRSTSNFLSASSFFNLLAPLMYVLNSINIFLIFSP